jgi:hypothetical protein
MSTYLDVKEAVAENLGKTDGSVYNTKREGAIKRARRKFYSEKPWSFLRKLGVTLTFTNNVASLPTDYNPTFIPLSVYSYSGNVKYDYRQVDWSNLAAFNNADWVYALNRADNTIKISQPDTTLLFDYIYLPADKTAIDGSQDNDVEPAPDTTAIELLATAYYYLSSRQSKSSYAQFMDAYNMELARLAKNDHQNDSVLFFRNPAPSISSGYHR